MREVTRSALRYVGVSILVGAGLLACDVANEAPECEQDGHCQGPRGFCVDQVCVECRERSDCGDAQACGAGTCMACAPLPDGPTCGAGFACRESEAGNACIYATVLDAMQPEGLGAMRSVLTDARKADLGAELSAAHALTVFAPTDDGFRDLSAECNAVLDGDPQLWVQLARNHILLDSIAVDRARLEAEVAAGPVDLPVQSLGTVRLSGEGGLRVDGRAVGDQIETANGIIHVVDGVLLSDALRAIEGCGDVP